MANTNNNNGSGRPILVEGQRNGMNASPIVMDKNPQQSVSIPKSNSPIKFDGANNGSKGTDLMQQVYGSNAPQLKPKKSNSQTPFGN